MKLSDLGDLDKGDLLSALGLAEQRSAAGRLWGTVGIFSVGLLVGAGAALLLAPTSGQGLREGLSERLRKAREGAVDEGDASDVPEGTAVPGEART